MEITDEIGVKNLEAYGDSKLIVNQVRGEYKVRHKDLISYYNTTITWPRGSENLTSTMYLASKMHMHMQWHF